jgi:NitT/TauT family transport system substrate-binding protein
MAYRRTGVLALFIAVAALLSAAGCSSGGSGTPPRSPGLEKSDLTVAVVPTTDSTGFYVALHEGLFAAQGLHIKYVPAASGERIINQQALGGVDISAGNYVSYIQAQLNYSRGLRATNIPDPNSTQIAADMDVFDEASVMRPGFVGLFTLPHSPITTAADLRGKTIGLNAPGNVAYLLLVTYLEENGVSPSSVHFKYFPFPVMTQALVSHQIDVAFLAEPFVSIAETTVGAVPLTSLDEAATHSFPIEGYAVTKQWAKRYPKTLAAFERALEQGQQIADLDGAAAEAAMRAFSSTDGVTPEIGAVLTFESYPLGAVDAERIQRVASAMRHFGLIPDSFDAQRIIG